MKKNNLRNTFFFKVSGLYEWFINWVYLGIVNTTSLIEDYYYDKVTGIKTRGRYFSDNSLALYKDSRIYRPIPYRRLKEIIDNLSLTSEDIFVDLGAGKGRVICVAAMKRLKKIIGVEMDKRLVGIARENISYLNLEGRPITIVHDDVANFDVSEGTVFFMFDPFGEETLKEVTDNIKESLVVNPRNIRIVYFRAIYRFLLDNQSWLMRQTEIYNKGFLIWTNKIDNNISRTYALE